MKKHLVAAVAAAVFCGSSAFAAEPIFNWTGFYVGMNAGYARGDRSFNLSGNDLASTVIIGGSTVTSASFKPSGVIGGGQAGFNWQYGRNWLFGIEADFDGSALNTNNALDGTFTGAPYTLNVQSKFDWFGTVRARAGFLPTDRLFVFGTGGFAYGHVNESVSMSSAATTITATGFTPGGQILTVVCLPNTTCYSGSGSRTATGWSVGGGFEYALFDRTTLKLEYLYVDLGHGTVIAPAGPAVIILATGVPAVSSLSANFHDAFHVLRAGINLKF